MLALILSAMIGAQPASMSSTGISTATTVACLDYGTENAPAPAIDRSRTPNRPVLRRLRAANAAWRLRALRAHPWLRAVPRRWLPNGLTPKANLLTKQSA